MLFREKSSVCIQVNMVVLIETIEKTRAWVHSLVTVGKKYGYLGLYLGFK